MFEYMFKVDVDIRDVVSEIDAGELDEQYLIKHANDYGKQSASHPLSALKAIVNRLLNSIRRSAQPQPSDQSAKTVSRSATR